MTEELVSAPGDLPSTRRGDLYDDSEWWKSNFCSRDVDA